MKSEKNPQLFFKFSFFSIEYFAPQRSFPGDIGGLLGLCIGASLLSIVEIMDLVGQLIFQTHHRLKMGSKGSSNKKAFNKKKEKKKNIDKNDRPLVSNYCTPGDFKWHERDPSNPSKLTAVWTLRKSRDTYRHNLWKNLRAWSLFEMISTRTWHESEIGIRKDVSSYQAFCKNDHFSELI